MPTVREHGSLWRGEAESIVQGVGVIRKCESTFFGKFVAPFGYFLFMLGVVFSEVDAHLAPREREGQREDGAKEDQREGVDG